MDDRIGSLKPGTRADLIMIDTRAVNIGIFTEPAHMIVEAAKPSNVYTVMIDGRILKQRGRLTAMDTMQVVARPACRLPPVRRHSRQRRPLQNRSLRGLRQRRRVQSPRTNGAYTNVFRRSEGNDYQPDGSQV